MYTFFPPRIGNEYAHTRVLVLGESHYCDKGCADCGLRAAHPECADFTQRVFNWYLDRSYEREGWMNTYLKFERALAGYATQPHESAAVWDKVAFFNYLQVAMGGPRQAGTREQYKQAEQCLYSVMQELRPRVMIVWGKQLWRHLPYAGWQDCEPLLIEGYEVDNGIYTLPDGHQVRTICIYHPSSAFEWDKWNKIITAFEQ